MNDQLVARQATFARFTSSRSARSWALRFAPGDVAADHPGLLDVAGVVGAVECEERSAWNCASIRLSHDA